MGVWGCGLEVQGPKLKVLVHFHTKVEPKDKDLNNGSRMSEADHFLQTTIDQPLLLVNGEGRPPSPPIPRSARLARFVTFLRKSTCTNFLHWIERASILHKFTHEPASKFDGSFVCEGYTVPTF